MAEASAATTIHAMPPRGYSSGGACLRHAHLTLPPPCSPHLASAMLTSPCLRHAHLTLPPPCSPHLASAMLTSPCHHCLLLYLLLCFLERSRPRRSARV